MRSYKSNLLFAKKDLENPQIIQFHWKIKCDVHHSAHFRFFDGLFELSNRRFEFDGPFRPVPNSPSSCSIFNFHVVINRYLIITQKNL